MPVYSVVELDVVRKPVCISPHFNYWPAGDRIHFLLNNLIEWWPPEEFFPFTVVRNPARGTGAVLNDTYDDSDDEDVTECPTAVWLEHVHIKHDYKLHLYNFVKTLLTF